MGHYSPANDSQDISLDQLHNTSRLSGESYERLLNDNDDVDNPSADTTGDNQRHISTYPVNTKSLLKETRKKLLKSGAINIVWILTWYTFATFLSVYNKWMFSADHYNFQFPLFVTSIHMIVQFVFAGSSLLLVPGLRPKSRPNLNEYLFKVFPCALATSLDIGLSNLSLKTITLSFYTMCKSSTLAFVLVFAFLFKLENPNLRLVGIIVIITAGVVLMVSDETEFVLTGFIQVMSAAAFGGLRWALTEVLLRKEGMGLTNPFASIFFLAPAQAVILVIIAGVVEGYGTIFGSAFFVGISQGLHTMGIILLGGVLAFCMIMAEFFLIKRTSVVTLSVCGIFKEVATIFISTIVFGDRLTVLNIIGLCVTLFGIGLYNWMKIRAASISVQKDIQNQNLEYNELYNVEDNGMDHGDDYQGHTLPDTTANQQHLKQDGKHHSGITPLYSMAAESVPILLADGGLSASYFDSNSEDDEDGKNHQGVEEDFLDIRDHK
ncbi:triose-phosphate transporter family-domain-containing protein [Absidia repens]|uniref:Triose-phosphate transporter family-domain-containing protein n=1 Tax=Absidia repens TaxID=90262 RepID=A0A1X2IZC7_9FUNG|nr:triose-phosphate transporter family-domain-containing protein [Absidia repens]